MNEPLALITRGSCFPKILCFFNIDKGKPRPGCVMLGLVFSGVDAR